MKSVRLKENVFTLPFRMNIKIIVLLTFSMIMLIFNSSFATGIIHIVPGPYGGSKIITPWGDYVAVEIGNTLWIGTAEEWNNAKADAVMRSHGAMRVQLEGEEKNERNYVDREAKSVSIGKTKLYAITTSILFGVKPSKKDKRPPKTINQEYVGIVWTPSDKSRVAAVISVGKRTIRATDCGKSGNFSYCEFIVDKADLTREAAVIFYSSRMTPAMMSVKSFAKQHFSDLSLKYKRMSGEVLSDDDASDLANLHALDASIPSTLAGHSTKTTLKLKICRVASGRLNNKKVRVAYPEFTVRGKRYNDNRQKTIYSVPKEFDLGPYPFCLTTTASVRKNPTNEPPPPTGAILHSEAMTVRGNVSYLDEMIQLEATVIESTN